MTTKGGFPFSPANPAPVVLRRETALVAVPFATRMGYPTPLRILHEDITVVRDLRRQRSDYAGT